MFLNSISQSVCKFQKDWMKNKKKMQNLATSPLTQYPMGHGLAKADPLGGI